MKLKAKKEYNILSIDWDYFIDATKKQRASLFPDGGTEALPIGIQEAIWVARYTNPHLEKISTLHDELEELRKIIEEGADKNTIFMIADSHEYIYSFINGYTKTDSILHLSNIDFHHDCFGKSRKVHCGNWLSHMMKNALASSTFEWIAREDSLIEKINGLKLIKEDFSSLKKNWDLVFICRSGMWSPPHLDDEFAKAFSWIIEDRPTELQQGIFESRYSEEFISSVNQLKGMMKTPNNR